MLFSTTMRGIDSSLRLRLVLSLKLSSLIPIHLFILLRHYTLNTACINLNIVIVFEQYYFDAVFDLLYFKSVVALSAWAIHFFSLKMRIIEIYKILVDKFLNKCVE